MRLWQSHNTPNIIKGRHTYLAAIDVQQHKARCDGGLHAAVRARGRAKHDLQPILCLLNLQAQVVGATGVSCGGTQIV